MLDLTKEVIKMTNYENLDSRVTDYLDKTILSLVQNKVQINDYTKLVLLMIISQLILYFKSLDEITSIDKVSSTDSYARKAKMPAISVMQTAHDKILVLLDKILASPMSYAKVSRLKEKATKEESAAELIAAITA